MKRLSLILDRILDRTCAIVMHADACYIYNRWVNSWMFTKYVLPVWFPTDDDDFEDE